jgi:hypothetical protein
MNNHLKIESSHLVWKILTLTEKAISLAESGQIDEALNVIENRERAMSILSGRQNISETDNQTLGQVGQLNEILLTKLIEAKDDLKREIGNTQRANKAHKSYHSNQVK